MTTEIPGNCITPCQKLFAARCRVAGLEPELGRELGSEKPLFQLCMAADPRLHLHLLFLKNNNNKLTRTIIVNIYQMPTLGLDSNPRAAVTLWGWHFCPFFQVKKRGSERSHLPKGVWLGCAELESNSCLSAPKMWLFLSRPPCSPTPTPKLGVSILMCFTSFTLLDEPV